MITGAGLMAALAGARRWLNAEAGKALMVAIVAVAVLIGAVMIYGAGGSATEAKVNWRWLQQITNANRLKAERRAADMAARAEKSAEAQQRAERERDAALERATALERDLAALGAADAIVISREERRRLFK
jgi:uncharacterized protein HemX